jgi:outer membrane protein assembly factor BamD (BamD/ComL family)
MPAPADDVGRMDRARSDFDQGRYKEVIYNLDMFLTARPGTKYVEEASFILGRALYERGLDFEAEDQFRKVLREFPGGVFRCPANYYLGLTLLAQARSPQLDQAERLSAKSQFNTFLNTCPDDSLGTRAEQHLADINNTLAEKIWLQAYDVYGRRGRHFREAERFYYKRVIDEYPESDWVARAMIGVMRSYDQDELWPQVACWAMKIMERFPESREAREAQSFLDNAERENVVPDGLDLDPGDCTPPPVSDPEDTTSAGSR